MADDLFGRDHPQLGSNYTYLNFAFLLIGEPLKQRKTGK